LISFGMPAGLVLYFAISNIYRVGIQWYITRSYFADEEASVKTGAKAKGPSKPATVRGVLKGEATPAKSKEKAGTDGGRAKPSGAQAKPSGGQSRSSGRGRSSSAKRKAFTSDPRDRQKRGTQGAAQPASPRPRKKKKRK
jgi:hypothetical protein